MANKNLNAAKATKNDEFYTKYNDIANEVGHYKVHFKNKIVFCNCDDPECSKFWQYFEAKFLDFGLKKLVATHYNKDGYSSYALIFEGEYNEDGSSNTQRIELKGNGDFRSPECVEFLKESDIVVTNCPFSLFREYIAQLIEYDKKFLIIGNQNAITYKEIFPLIKENKVWLGYHCGDMAFKVPADSEPRKTRYWQDETGQKWRSMGNICWYTNLDIEKRHKKLILLQDYNIEDYPTYDNYNARNVDKVANIPDFYDGAMGVPITFLDKHNPDQFEILDANDYRKNDKVAIKQHGLIKDKDGSINGKPKYVRILIKRKDIQ